MLAASAESGEETEIFTEADIELYTELYGLEAYPVLRCAVARMGGPRVFELAVIRLASPSPGSDEALAEYVTQRWADFSGYSPAEAAIAQRGLVLCDSSGTWLALIISADPEPVAAAFRSCFDGSISQMGPADPDSSAPYVPEGRLPYVDPNIDDMTIYDTGAILAAWESGDRSGLSPYDRTILERAEKIIGSIISEDMTPLEKETAVYRWITGHISYDYDHYDPKADLSPDSSTPYNPLVEGKGICLGFSVTFQLFMDLLDIPCITVIGAAFSSMEDHAWNMVNLNGEWYCVDSTWDTGTGRNNWLYFNVTSDKMASTNHQWDYESVPEATATDGGKGK